MSTPFSFSGALSFPPDVGVPPELVAIAFNAQYDQLTWLVMQLSGSGTKVVPFGGIAAPGAKFVMVKADAANNAAPINLQWNAGGAPGEQEVAPGGFFALGSAAPTTGLTSLSILYTSAITVRVLLLG